MSTNVRTGRLAVRAVSSHSRACGTGLARPSDVSLPSASDAASGVTTRANQCAALIASGFSNVASAGIIVLLVMLLMMNAVAIWVRSRTQRVRD